MCCLTYEHDAYLQARKRFPREGKVIRTAQGSEKVIGIDIWHDQVTLLDEARQRRVVALAELKVEIDSARQRAPEIEPEPEPDGGEGDAGPQGAGGDGGQQAGGQPPSSRRRRRRRSNGRGGSGE